MKHYHSRHPGSCRKSCRRSARSAGKRLPAARSQHAGAGGNPEADACTSFITEVWAPEARRCWY